MKSPQAITKLRDFMPGALPAELLISMSKNDQRLTLTVPAGLKDRRFECVYDETTKIFTLYEAEPDKGVKVGYSITGKNEYYKLIFSPNKWAKTMPALKSSSFKLKINNKNEYTLNMQEVFKDIPEPVKTIEVQDNVEDHNKMSVAQARRCIQYLNKFIEDPKGEGFKFAYGNETRTRIKLQKVETIE